MNETAQTIANSLAGLPENTRVYNYARDLRRAQLHVSPAVPDDRLVENTAGELAHKLAALSESPADSHDSNSDDSLDDNSLDDVG